MQRKDDGDGDFQSGFPSLLCPAGWRQVQTDHGLTRRETEVLEAATRGVPEADLARAMGVALDTVRKHRRSALRKLGARNRLSAALHIVHRYVKPTGQTGDLPPRGNCLPSG